MKMQRLFVLPFVQYPDTVWGVVRCATLVSAEQLLPFNLSACGSSLLSPSINLDLVVVFRKTKCLKISILHFKSITSKHHYSVP